MEVNKEISSKRFLSTNFFVSYCSGGGGPDGGAGGGGSSFSIVSAIYTTGYQSGPGSVSISFLVNQPSSQPTQQPTSKPSIPTSQPSRQPTRQPSSQPSFQPSTKPTCQPSRQPSSRPSCQPSSLPTKQPSTQPTTQPTVRISSSLKNGLVAYYPFDGNANDNSGNSNHGDLHGGVSLVADRFGNVQNAYLFDGNSGFISVPGQQFNFVYNMSFSVWIKYTTDLIPWLRVFDKCTYNNGVFQAGWSFERFASGPNQFYFASVSAPSAGDVTPLMTLVKNQWNHVVMTKKGLAIRMYLNGVLVNATYTGTHPTIVSNGNMPLFIGASCGSYANPIGTAGSMFNGVIDDVFIFNRTLSERDVSLLYLFDSPTSQPSGQPSRQPTSQPSTQPTVRISSSLKNGLVAYYPFDGNADDNSGNGNHGMIRGGVSLVPDRFGQTRNAYTFDGSSGCIEIAGQQFNFARNMSISLWLQPFSSQTSWAPSLLNKSTWNRTYSPGGWTLQQKDNHLNSYEFAFTSRTAQQSTATNRLFRTSPSLQWNHFVVIKQSASVKVFVNAVLNLTMSFFTKDIVSTGNLPLMIGCTNNGYTIPASGLDGFYKGAVDDIFVFNRSLSTEEVTLLYDFEVPTSQPSRQPSSQPFGQPSSSPTFPSAHVFSFTGTIQNITVPSTARFISVDIKGAAGGQDSVGIPGKGARVQATIPVTGGSVLHIYVGGQGGLPTGGWNGGGDGFGAGGGAGGGGASDIRVGGNSLANRIVVAGGGGGMYTDSDCGGSQKGGDGGEIGTMGSTALCFSPHLAGGGGGTATAGGMAGQPNLPENHVATAGSLGLGGKGATGSGSWAGGGGGGYYGGKSVTVIFVSDK
jgi:hypothetical protein